jgi:hypothetical protein
MSDEHGLRFWQRIVIVTLSATIGAAAVVWYLLDQQRQQAESGEHRRSLRPGGIRLQPSSSPKPGVTSKPVAPTALTLQISTRPRTFKRGSEGTVQAKTLPGALCTLNARYSTGRAPSGLEEGPLSADADGVCAWTWSIGTSGSHVDVKVTATQNGFADVTKSKRISIED